MLYKKVGKRYVQATAADVYAEAGRLSAASRSRSGPPPVLTEEQKAEVRRRAHAGEKQCDLASEYRVSESLISMIVRWKK